MRSFCFFDGGARQTTEEEALKSGSTSIPISGRKKQSDTTHRNAVVTTLDTVLAAPHTQTQHATRTRTLQNLQPRIASTTISMCTHCPLSQPLFPTRHEKSKQTRGHNHPTKTGISSTVFCFFSPPPRPPRTQKLTPLDPGSAQAVQLPSPPSIEPTLPA